ncbi:cache domain-containing sensor histidine kinase [Paenibacillus nasutitermitis]|uniref:Sensor histidine kinase YesM n=1 Tax=Paenibacillus nasutitermitis TaxID=1652958 RepID=A0A917E2D5_9BACL|nr:sensor histidine kinase [Paenibacillus nasutitermitis]GGD93796.1 sensor histidine kinase YesM [Paenibacillus nasutitermitis]
MFWKWFSLWRTIRLPQKLLMVYMPLIILPAAAGIYLMTQSYTSSSKQISADYSKDLLSLMVLKINDRLSGYEHLSRQIMTDESLQKLILTEPESSFEKLQIQNEINKKLNVIWQGDEQNKYVLSIKLSAGQEVYTYGKNMVDGYRTEDPAYIKGLEQAAGGSAWFYPETFSDGYRETVAFRLGRVIRSTNLSPLGYLTVAVDAQAVTSIFDQTQFRDRVQLQLLAPGGRILLDNGVTVPKEDKKVITYQEKSLKNNWSLGAIMSLEPIYKPIYQVSRQALFIVAGCIAVGLAVTHFIAVDLVIPIRILMRNMKLGVKGVNPKSLRRFRGAVEIVEMNDTFISVMYEIEQLIRQVVKEQQIKQSAEIRVLQNQLSPHFLYNTLNSIRWMAMIEKQDHIKEMIDSLNHLLSYSIRGTGQPVKLREELAVMEDYAKIQQVRYQHFRLIMDVEEPLLNTEVLKFLLQPLIENALIHGISNKVEQGEIRIGALLDKDTLELSVADNGAGMKAAKLAALQEELHHSTENAVHLGLRNIHERIQLHYGKRYGLEIESVPDHGTKVRLRLPFQEISGLPETAL